MSAPEVIEGTAREVEPETRAVAVVTGTASLAALTDAEFDARLAQLTTHRERVQRVQRALMTKDVHYGVIPGTDKPTLLLPGAEVLCDAYQLKARFDVQRIVGDGTTTPHLSYLTTCHLHAGSLEGPELGAATGTANSWEKRYRYRNAERKCPNCGQAAVIKGKAEYGGGWLCWPKKNGCNSKWRDGDPAIEGQVAGQAENPDPFDLDVVLDAMAAKRAFVHATRRALAVSDLFTSDVEDLPDNDYAPATPAARPQSAAPRPAERPQQPAGATQRPVEHRAAPEGLTGKVAVGKPPVDCERRQTPDGVICGFSLEADGKRLQVVAEGPMAESLSYVVKDAIGKPVSCWGRIEYVAWEKDGKTMPPYRRLHLERIEGPGFAIPGQAATPADLDAEMDRLPF